MGPPDWWEEYESRREGSATSTNSQASSTIEITTMYLGSSKDTTTSTIKSRPTPASTTSPDRLLTTSSSSQHSQITSAQSLAEPSEEDNASKEIFSRSQKKSTLHKSASGKSADLGIAESSEFWAEKKSHRSAWGRVKDIIHTRKDSIRKKLKRDRPGMDNEDARDISADVLPENFTGHANEPSPVANKQKTKVGSESPPKKTGVSPKTGQGYTHGNVDMAVLLGRYAFGILYLLVYCVQRVCFTDLHAKCILNSRALLFSLHCCCFTDLHTKSLFHFHALVRICFFKKNRQIWRDWGPWW